jgi:tellurite resistance protein
MIRFTMTPAERNIVKSLIAVAWADGQMESAEASVVEGLLVGFDATEEEEQELLEWAKTPRSLDKDLPLDELTSEDRELLLANAALLTLADGKQTADETKALGQLVVLLKIDTTEAKTIIASAADGLLSLSSRSLS